MAARYRLAERVFLPAEISPYQPKPDEPHTRPLWVYAVDPANIGLRRPTLRIDVPYEPLTAGPSGRLFAVATEALQDDLRKLLDWNEDDVAGYVSKPLDLDDLRMALGGGLAPTTGDLRFAGQMAYAVCHQVYDVFRRALGRNPAWGPWVIDRVARGEATHLLIKPYSFNDTNACYDPGKGTLEFGYFVAGESSSPYVLPGGLVFAALSQDIVSHELTHAILDGMRAEFMRNTNPDVAAFHEAFADIVSLFNHFSQEELLEQAISDSQGEVTSDLLLDLGRQFGEAVHGSIGGALRRALARKEGPATPVEKLIKYGADQPAEQHERGSILVSAVFEAFLVVYKRRSHNLFRVARSLRPKHAQDIPIEIVELLAESARKVAQHFLFICIRAIDYSPPVDMRFGTFLRAMITADSDAVPDDKYGYRDALIKAFRRRNIEIRHVRDLSEDSLRWRAPCLPDPCIPKLAFSRLRFSDNGVNQPTRKEIERRASALGDYLVANAAHLSEFGLHECEPPYGDIEIQSIRLARRTASDGLARSELVAEVTQKRQHNENVFVGGATLLIGMDGAIRYSIRRRVDDFQRRRAEIHFAGPQGASRIDFRLVHKMTSYMSSGDAQPERAKDVARVEPLQDLPQHP